MIIREKYYSIDPAPELSWANATKISIDEYFSRMIYGAGPHRRVRAVPLTRHET